MKKLYTLILMAMAAITATAADLTYMPMVREGVEWHYATQNVRQGGTDTGNIYLRFDGSETVDGKTYSVLYRYDTPAFDKAKAQIAAYMREDGHKVYAICKIKPAGTSPATTKARTGWPTISTPLRTTHLPSLARWTSSPWATQATKHCQTTP